MITTQFNLVPTLHHQAEPGAMGVAHQVQPGRSNNLPGTRCTRTAQPGWWDSGDGGREQILQQHTGPTTILEFIQCGIFILEVIQFLCYVYLVQLDQRGLESSSCCCFPRKKEKQQHLPDLAGYKCNVRDFLNCVWQQWS